MKSERYGVLVQHESSVRQNAVINIERDSRGRYFVRTRTAGVATYESERPSESAAREHWEAFVAAHEERGV